MKHTLFCLFLSACTAVVGAAGEESTVKSISLPGDDAMAKLKPGLGVDTVRANCVACHSTDYIVRQPGSDAKSWGEEVRKMITVFGAPITEADAKIIVEYLSSAYGLRSKRKTSIRKGKPGSPR